MASLLAVGSPATQAQERGSFTLPPGWTVEGSEGSNLQYQLLPSCAEAVCYPAGTDDGPTCSKLVEAMQLHHLRSLHQAWLDLNCERF